MKTTTECCIKDCANQITEPERYFTISVPDLEGEIKMRVCEYHFGLVQVKDGSYSIFVVGDEAVELTPISAQKIEE